MIYRKLSRIRKGRVREGKPQGPLVLSKTKASYIYKGVLVVSTPDYIQPEQFNFKILPDLSVEINFLKPNPKRQLPSYIRKIRSGFFERHAPLTRARALLRFTAQRQSILSIISMLKCSNTSLRLRPCTGSGRWLRGEGGWRSCRFGRCTGSAGRRARPGSRRRRRRSGWKRGCSCAGWR